MPEVLDRVSYAPHPHFMLSMMRANLPWWKAIGELIDNAFDHGATRVVVTTNPKWIEIQDDGTGIKSLVHALSLGDHQPSEHTALGMYGVGLKDAWLSVGNRIDVVSIHKGIESSVSLNTSDFLPPDWSAPAPTTRDATTSSGTTIRLHFRPRKHKPDNNAWSTIAWVFTPALKRGKQIVRRDGTKKKPLAPVELPPLTERVTEAFEVDGKQVSIDIGITAEGEHLERGPFWIQYGHRVICSSSLGASNYNTSRLAGTITLGKGWALTKNKDDLADFSDELGDAIESRIRPLLEKSQELSEEIEATALKLEIEGSLKQAIASAKRESRGDGETTGTVLPTESGGKRRRAQKSDPTQPGSVDDELPDAKRRGIKFSWRPMGDSLVGEYEPMTKLLTLNSVHPFAASIRKQGNRAAIEAIAISILSNHLANTKDGNKTLFEVNDFNQCLGLILKSVKVENGNSK